MADTAMEVAAEALNGLSEVIEAEVSYGRDLTYINATLDVDDTYYISDTLREHGLVMIYASALANGGMEVNFIKNGTEREQ